MSSSWTRWTVRHVITNPPMNVVECMHPEIRGRSDEFRAVYMFEHRMLVLCSVVSVRSNAKKTVREVEAEAVAKSAKGWVKDLRGESGRIISGSSSFSYAWVTEGTL